MTTRQAAPIADTSNTYAQIVTAAERAFMAGEQASIAGLPITANPYREDDDDYESWNLGWTGTYDD